MSILNRVYAEQQQGLDEKRLLAAAQWRRVVATVAAPTLQDSDATRGWTSGVAGSADFSGGAKNSDFYVNYLDYHR